VLKTIWWKPLKAAKNSSIYIFTVSFKATKSRSRAAFSFALQGSRLLEKAAFCIQPFGLAFGFYGAKAKAKSQTKHTLKPKHLVITMAYPYKLCDHPFNHENKLGH
jgi:hypothetical protein